MRRHVVLGFVVASMVGCVTTGKYQQQVAATQAAQKQIADAQTALDQAKKSADQCQTDLSAAQKQMETDKQAQADLQTRVKTDEDQIAKLQQQNAQLAKDLETEKSSKEHGKKKH